MADISKINVNSTTYNLKDSRIPALPGSTSTYLRGDGTWTAPTVSTMTSASDVSDEGTSLLITPASGGGGGSVNLQAKTGIVPSESSQTITADSGYDGLSSVQINAVSSTYVGSGVTRQQAVTLTPGRESIVVPAGRYLVGDVDVLGDTNLASNNIVNGISLFGVTGLAPRFQLLGTADLNVNTTSTSAGSAGTINCGSSAWTSSKIIYVRVRDKAGARDGYFIGSDSFFFNYNAANGSTSTLTTAIRMIHRLSGSGVYGVYGSGGTTGYGVYGYSITSAGVVNIYRRYNSTNSLTINGTYEVNVYAVDHSDGVSIYDI